MSSPFFRQIFVDQQISNVLRPIEGRLLQHRIQDIDLILASSRKALISFEEIEVNSIAKYLYEQSNVPNMSNDALSHIEKERLYRLAFNVRYDRGLWH